MRSALRGSEAIRALLHSWAPEEALLPYEHSLEDKKRLGEGTMHKRSKSQATAPRSQTLPLHVCTKTVIWSVQQVKLAICELNFAVADGNPYSLRQINYGPHTQQTSHPTDPFSQTTCVHIWAVRPTHLCNVWLLAKYIYIFFRLRRTLVPRLA